MRRSLPFVMMAAAALVLAACAEDPRDVTPGVSGRAPEAATTTTAPPAPTTTEPPDEQVVDVPDIDDLGLTWDEEPVVDDGTGGVNMGDFNDFLRAEAPPVMVAPDRFEGLDEDEIEQVVDEALPEAAARTVALFLGLDPDDDSVQMLVRPGGQPGSAEVVVVELADDDSVRAVRWAFRIEMESRAGLAAAEEEAEGIEDDAVDALEADDVPEEATGASAPDLVPVVYGGTRTFQCQPDRGQQDFATASCQ